MSIGKQLSKGGPVEAIELLKTRTSCAQLTEPKPTAQQLEVLYEVAFRAADHRLLKPVRFLEIEGQGLDRLGELFVHARKVADPQLDSEAIAKARAMPKRAPMIIAAIACMHDDDKVPDVEQLLSAGASVQNMLNAAYGLGLGAIWRTGELAYDDIVTDGLGLESHEQLIGFLYLGTPRAGFRDAPAYDWQKHIKQWS